MASFNYTKSGKNVSKLQLERIQRYLEKINKTPVRLIKSPDGDIIDCVPINKQPAFDHPLLKNHKIQRVPPSLRRFENEHGQKNYTATGRIAWQAWNEVGHCPRGTIPIRRITVQDVLRAKSLDHFGKKEVNHFNKKQVKAQAISVVAPDDANYNSRDHEYAIVRSQGEFYGAKATINVWNPNVELTDEFSLAQIWVHGGYGSDHNTIEAGWQVYAKMYGDNNARLFGFWSKDDYQTGCYNLVCPGFVQTTDKVAFGGVMTPVSSFGGQQFEIDLLISKDSKTGNWWLKFKGGDQNVFLGYWPGLLFTFLKDRPASGVDFGGEVINRRTDGQHTSTQMGSGHFAGEGYGKASYFHSLQVADSDNNLHPVMSLRNIANNKDCYDVNSAMNDDSWGTYFYYGGPGRNPKCP